MEKDYLLYMPTKEEIKGPNYWEVWSGLPQNLEFENTLSSGKEASLKYDKNKMYIWVPPKALTALNQNRNAIFLALNSKKESDLEMNVSWLFHQEGRLEDAIKKAKKLNGMKMEAEN